jgi:hypothetical protein
VIWTSPSGHTYVTTPGSALLFPALSVPTGELPEPQPRTEPCTERAAMMPTRQRTRAQNRAHHINTERRHNQQTRQAAHLARAGPPDPCDEPPPF